MGSIGLFGLLLKIVFGCFVALIAVMTLGVAAVGFKKGWDNTHDHKS